MSINGANYRSAIVLLTADDIEGDWTYVGPVTYSGFEKGQRLQDRRLEGARRRRRPDAVHVADRHRHQRDRPVRQAGRQRRPVDDVRLMVRRHVDVQARSEDRPARLQHHVPDGQEPVRRLLRHQARRRFRQLRRRLVPAAYQRPLVSVRILRQPAADRRLPGAHVPRRQDHRSVHR